MPDLAIVTASATSHHIAGAALIVLNLCAIYLCYLCVIAVHEAGHWFAAKLCAFVPLEFRVGPICWLAGSGWGLQWRWHNLVTGWVLAQPTKRGRALRLRYLTFVLAGPLSNLLVSAVIVSLDRGQTRLEGAAIFVAMFSLMMGVVNLLPFENKELRSDGLRVFDILSVRGFRKIRFAASYIDSKDELIAALRGHNFERAKLLSESVLEFAVESPQTEIMMKALRRILEIAEQGIRAQKGQSVSAAAPLAAAPLSDQ
jgi:hypothetical protein